MLEYEWGNPSMIMFNSDENPPENDQNRQFLDPYTSHGFHEHPGSIAFINTNPQYGPTNHHPPPFPGVGHHFNQSIYDPLASYGESSYVHNATQASFLSIEPDGPTGYTVVPKSEPLVSGIDFGNAGRIGLNLGGRTYFASSEDDFVSRLYRRSRVAEPGSINSPRCQAEGCNADLSNAKHYHRRHKVCEYHSKAATVITAGLTQRFCQQCSRFHLLSEFDNGKRSCRKRLADHNRRRRKSQQQPPSPSQEHPNKSLREHAPNSPPPNSARSPPASGAQSSTVTVALSPPRMSLDGFRQRSYQVGTSSSASTSSVFYSNG